MSVKEERFDLVDEFHLFEFDGELNMFNDTGDGYQRLGLCYYADESKAVLIVTTFVVNRSTLTHSHMMTPFDAPGKRAF